jgi:hypothetical protein
MANFKVMPSLPPGQDICPGCAKSSDIFAGCVDIHSEPFQVDRGAHVADAVSVSSTVEPFFKLNVFVPKDRVELRPSPGLDTAVEITVSEPFAASSCTLGLAALAVLHVTDELQVLSPAIM